MTDWLDSFVWMTLERKCYLPLSWDSEGVEYHTLDFRLQGCTGEGKGDPQRTPPETWFWLWPAPALPCDTQELINLEEKSGVSCNTLDPLLGGQKAELGSMEWEAGGLLLSGSSKDTLGAETPSQWGGIWA